MKTELIIIGLLFIHFIADFVFQTDWQAKNKSKDFIALITHTSTYSLLFGILLLLSFIVAGIDKFEYYLTVIPFISITFIIHTIQDYITSRINSFYYKQGPNKAHQFFVSVGFDQFLHFVQLILTYKLLFNEL